MRLKPLQQWICDECGEVIEGVAQGYVEWLVDDELCAYGFRIVHHALLSPRKPVSDCYRYTDATHRDVELTRFVGDTGIPALLALIDRGSYHVPEYKGPKVSNMRSWIELFRRLHIKYYEEARLYWDSADADGYFSGGNEVSIYLPKTLKSLIERYRI